MKFQAKGAGLNVGIKAVNWKEEPLEGVVIEVKRNGVTIATTTSGKKGKYSFEIPITSNDPKNDYVIYISKDGMGPKMVNINAYVAKPEFTKYPPSAKYDVELDLPMISTTVKGVVPDKPFAKIKWDQAKEHKFVVDPGYAKVAQSEELKILGNSDQYYTALAKKKKKAEDALALKQAAADAKVRAAEEAKRKADEEAQRLADLKAREEADRLARERAEKLRKEVLAKHIADSLAEVERRKGLQAGSTQVEVKKNARPAEDESQKQYDVSETFSINIARRSLSAEKEKRSREKGKNLSAKYETINVLTSFLNVVDEYDKKNRK
jgi:hypothetical protein